jgi:hypothetical protein
MHSAGGVNGDRFLKPIVGSRSARRYMKRRSVNGDRFRSVIDRGKAVRLNGPLVPARDTNRD